MKLPSEPVPRRLVTVPAVLAAFAVVTVLLPVLGSSAVIIDALRWVGTRKPWMATRALAFLWVYLAGEVWALIAIAVTTPLPAALKTRATYALQESWTGWSLAAVIRLFELKLDVVGDDQVDPGPILVISRHASLIDTLLPAQLISKPHGIDLRYVLKRELLADPALDLAGNRLPNAFITRSGGGGADVAAIRRLGSQLGPRDGVLIYPEGTRFSEAKLRRITERANGSNKPPAFRSVLPPRPAGTLTLLESGDADVVVMAHHGLEALSSVSDAWSGHLVGSTISVRLWRIDREEIPSDREGRLEWLMKVWGQVDDWVTTQRREKREH
ncbi:MAG: lysophospholipid acyltransferase family protein [Acidimicrobiia bacterium]|nr:lysophospholipid acyltransferase family protein [Acidimicrobiia bacterium]